MASRSTQALCSFRVFTTIVHLRPHCQTTRATGNKVVPAFQVSSRKQRNEEGSKIGYLLRKVPYLRRREPGPSHPSRQGHCCSYLRYLFTLLSVPRGGNAGVSSAASTKPTSLVTTHLRRPAQILPEQQTLPLIQLDQYRYNDNSRPLAKRRSRGGRFKLTAIASPLPGQRSRSTPSRRASCVPVPAVRCHPRRISRVEAPAQPCPLQRHCGHVLLTPVPSIQTSRRRLSGARLPPTPSDRFDSPFFWLIRRLSSIR